MGAVREKTLELELCTHRALDVEENGQIIKPDCPSSRSEECFCSREHICNCPPKSLFCGLRRSRCKQKDRPQCAKQVRAHIPLKHWHCRVSGEHACSDFEPVRQRRTRHRTDSPGCSNFNEILLLLLCTLLCANDRTREAHREQKPKPLPSSCRDALCWTSRATAECHV